MRAKSKKARQESQTKRRARNIAEEMGESRTPGWGAEALYQKSMDSPGIHLWNSGAMDPNGKTWLAGFHLPLTELCYFLQSRM